MRGARIWYASQAMRSAIAAAAIVLACAGSTPAPSAPVTAAAPAPAPPAPKPAVPAPDDARVTQLSHDVLVFFDKGDAAKLEAVLAPGFVKFEGGRPETRADVLAAVKARKPGVDYIKSRTWDKERVFRDGDHLVFIGKAHEEQGGNDSHGGYLFDGWYMLQWARTGDAWQVQLWTWQKESASRDFWNDVFRTGRGFTQEPNKLLVSTVKGKKPGTALDLATGQGRNGLYLATQGWKVTGVDISDTGLRIANEQARAKKVAFEGIEADLDKWDFGKDRWDLVTMIYTPSKVEWIEKIKPSLKKGGLVVIDSWADDGDGGWKAGQLAKLFEGYEILRDETVEDHPDWAQDKGKLQRFVARKR
jgi:SAM-dependent methyltransferase